MEAQKEVQRLMDSKRWIWIIVIGLWLAYIVWLWSGLLIYEGFYEGRFNYMNVPEITKTMDEVVIWVRE